MKPYIRLSLCSLLFLALAYWAYAQVPIIPYPNKVELKGGIAYAGERQIEIIPEISMPGHVSAAVASYPFLGVTK